MSWNWAHTKRKQKEMAEKSASYQKENDTYQYIMYKKPQTHEWRREQERQHRVKLISIAMITLVCIIGISVISYFVVYGV